jgi:hypothetical protein
MIVIPTFHGVVVISEGEDIVNWCLEQVGQQIRTEGEIR